jgi:hypothetical protein
VNEVQQLAVPLSQSQIDAAIDFWKKGGWETPEILQIKKVFPSCDEAIGVKAMAINALYGTNIRAITVAGECIKRVLNRVHASGPELVEELVAEMKEKLNRNNYSFAAKYAHFFIDSTLPILDGYAEWMVGQHLGPSMQSKNPKRYLKFTDDIETLKRVAQLQYSCADLDKYLWMAGEYRYWKAYPKTQISADLKPYFETLETDTEKEPDLAKAFGL